MGRAVSTITCHTFHGPPWRKKFYLFYLWNTARSHCVCKRGHTSQLKVDPQGHQIPEGPTDTLRTSLQFILPSDMLTCTILLWALRGKLGNRCSLYRKTSYLEKHLSGSHSSEPSDCLPALLSSSSEPDYMEKSWTLSKKRKSASAYPELL